MRFPVSVREWEGVAQRKLTADVYDFFTGAAGDEAGKQANSDALSAIKRLNTLREGNIMPVITIQQSPRSVDLKRRLAKELTGIFVSVYEIPPEAVQIFFSEASHENWAKGGVLAADNHKK
ncbi:hypothetical protein GCM10009414_01390 [Tatumella terrea]|uniref:Tautomerase family protein n=1 Tax=Tatumella terrea TaxID=419007 RepID=A0ABW1W2X3_9GAMM